jgi:hypothetical protein
MISRFYITVAFLMILLINTGPVFAAQSPIDRINRDRDEGRISLGQSLYYKLLTVRNPAELPPEYRLEGQLIAPSATPIMLEVMREFAQLPDAEQEMLKDYRNRPTATHSYDSPSGYFKIHYSIEGVNSVPLEDLNPANGIPDYVEWVGEYCDSSYLCIHENLGYIVPPSDNGEGGDDRFDIYILDMPYYGYTQPEAPGPESWDDYICYTVIHNSFDLAYPNDDPEGVQKGAAKVTCAHEYFHAVQFAYTYLAEIWYMEVSSSWMEEICYPVVNDNYNYFSDFFDYPYYALNAIDSLATLHQYGAFVWNRFLDQYYDTTLIRNIWEDMIYSVDAYQVLEDNLQDYGGSLADAFSEFALWNWCTSYRDDGNHYEDGAEYADIEITATQTFYPTGTIAPPHAHRPDGLASNYIRFINQDEIVGDLVLWFDGIDSHEWQANLILAAPGNEYTFSEIPLNSAAAGSLVVKAFDLYEYVILNPVVRSWYGDTLDYTYAADILPLPDCAVEVSAAGPQEIYSNHDRTVSFWVHNRGAKLEMFLTDVSDEMGWGLDLLDTLTVVRLRDSSLVSVILSSGPGLVPGTVNTVFLTATSSSSDTVFFTGGMPIQIVRHNGDSNNDGTINVSDAVWIINYIFVGASHPLPETYSGDANCDEIVNVSDAVYIINYVFVGGPPPPCLIY